MRKPISSPSKQESNIVIGIDPSLTASGVIILDDGKLVLEKVIKSKPSGDRPIDEVRRISTIVDEIVAQFIGFGTPTIVAMEGLAFMARNTSALVQLAGLNYMIRNELRTRGIPFVIVTPSTLKKFVTGHGNAPKDVMMLETYKRFGVSFMDNNICDAYGLAQVAYVLSGGKSSTTKEQREATELLKKQLQ
jgi:crossover junction endodeoxyribonuclease RuvC